MNEYSPSKGQMVVIERLLGEGRFVGAANAASILESVRSKADHSWILQSIREDCRLKDAILYGYREGVKEMFSNPEKLTTFLEGIDTERD